MPLPSSDWVKFRAADGTENMIAVRSSIVAAVYPASDSVFQLHLIGSDQTVPVMDDSLQAVLAVLAVLDKLDKFL